MHAICALITTPKLPFSPNVKACAKSSHHEDFVHALTFGWFGDVFLFSVLSAQQLTIFGQSYINFLQSRYCW
jgi:hypothetical protein